NDTFVAPGRLKDDGFGDSPGRVSFLIASTDALPLLLVSRPPCAVHEVQNTAIARNRLMDGRSHCLLVAATAAAFLGCLAAGCQDDPAAKTRGVRQREAARPVHVVQA